MAKGNLWADPFRFHTLTKKAKETKPQWGLGLLVITENKDFSNFYVDTWL